MLRAQVQSLANHGIIWIEREVVQRSDCMAANLYPPSTHTSHSAISVGSRKDGDEYLQKRLCKVPPRMRTLVPPTSVVIEEIIESPVDLRLPALKKEQTIDGFAPLILSLLGTAKSSLEFVQKGTPAVPVI